MTRAIAFDFDGVLVGIETHTAARIETFAEFAAQTGDERFNVDPSIQHEAHQHGSHSLAIIGWVLRHQGLVSPDADPTLDPLTERVVARKNQIYMQKVAAGLDALPGSLESLQWAAQTFGQEHTAIVTTAPRDEVNPFINRYHLSGHIGFVIAREDVPSDKLKPDPLAYVLAVQRFGLTARECVAIEDSVRGLASARAAGMVGIGITTTHRPEQLATSATAVASSFSEVPDIISGLNKIPLKPSAD